MWKTTEGSSGRLAQLCCAYFVSYVVTGVTVKYFLGPAADGYPGMTDFEFLFYSTVGGTALCLVVAIAARWYRLESADVRTILGLRVPGELAYIIPSGVCTAVVIPTTTLMYSLPVSVMVAMVIMRGSVIVISRAVDAIQIRQGILHRKVYREEDLAVVFALAAVGVHLVWAGKGGFDFVHSVAAMATLGSYIVAYALRIYIMNYFKNTRGKGVRQDNKGFFALEQISASMVLVVAGVVLYHAPSLFGWDAPQIRDFRHVVETSSPHGTTATLAGMAYGAVAFFSVFIFMFQGRTATFAGLVNRLTSLVAGTTATILSALLFGGRFPKTADWISLGFILVAVRLLTMAERKRAAEAQAR